MQRWLALNIYAQRLLKSFRAHFIFIWALGVALPYLSVSVILHSPLFSAIELDYSAIGASMAILASVVFIRKVTAFPGVSALGYVLPTLAGFYGVVILIALGLRVNYSNTLIFSSFSIALTTSFLWSYLQETTERRHFYLVSAGRIDVLRDIPGVKWTVLEQAVLPQDPRTVIVADLRFDHGDDWQRMLANAALQGHPVYHTKQLRESLTGKVNIEHLSENSFGSLLPNLAYVKVKRALDFLVSTFLLAALIIPFIIIGIIVKLDSSGPALFTQERVGYRGVVFIVYKFRSMRVVRHDAVSADSNADITEDGDQRITRVGRFLRRTRLDEMPQLLNVFLGDMSLIGPRPEALSLSKWYEAELPFYSYRHIVRPGITGWAQVNQGHVADLFGVHTKLHYDFYYIKNFSAWMDILIAMRTIVIMFTGFGAK